MPEIFNFMSFIKDSKIEKLSYPVRLTNNLFDILFKSINERVTLAMNVFINIKNIQCIKYIKYLKN